jgi:hypothetical protein
MATEEVVRMFQAEFEAIYVNNRRTASARIGLLAAGIEADPEASYSELSRRTGIAHI